MCARRCACHEHALLRFAVKDANELDELLSRIKTFGDSRTTMELKTLFRMKDLPVPPELL